jgi:hypothetical protein
MLILSCYLICIVIQLVLFLILIIFHLFFDLERAQLLEQLNSSYVKSKALLCDLPLLQAVILEHNRVGQKLMYYRDMVQKSVNNPQANRKVRSMYDRSSIPKYLQ